MSKLLIVVDMQNDFIDGALGTPEAQSIVNPVKDFIDLFDGDVWLTQDTHTKDYLNTQEGKMLPVEHCITGTHGWEINPIIQSAFDAKWDDHEVPSYAYEKPTFGSMALAVMLWNHADYQEIHFVGLCTGICVISNAVLAKAALPEAKIYIHKDLCACVTPESHERALESMRTLQMLVV